MYWCGNNKRKSRWSMRLLGPGIVIGHESLANVWTCHRIAVVKVVGNHVRLAEVEEQLPWRDLYDPLCHTDEQTYVDPCPLGASRNPQYEGPSTSSDAPMTPTPVADESTPDATAGEPDTSGIPVLLKPPMHAPVRKPRVPWRSDALESPRHRLLNLLCLRNMCLQPHHPGLHLCQSSMLTLIHNPKLHCQHPTDDAPMPLHHDDDTPPWVYQEHHKINHQTFYSKCRRHPYMFLRHGRSRTCPLVIQLFRRHLVSTKLHHHHQNPMKTFYLRPLRSTRLHHSDRHRPQNIPTIPSVAKRRSGTLHLENPVSKRWRSDTSYPETPVPTTASSQLRWRAGDLRALRPFRRLRGKQRDPSEVSAKRPRLAPAQVISTALTKSCDWSLGVAERSHTIGEITKDWSHSIFLTGRAARKEVHFASVSPEKQRLLLGAMAREWKKWRSTRQHCH